ncbi:carbohydrate kinase family protein (plasmid) [Pedobacter sp. BS3]|uniref:carbohydrate kinase family protein n=1 Tax=Pedobacter sp. BS3 TaxID=2567937 RepID=UPI0011EC2E7B|nr:carbohydrate kinase family protein [Pedobacter sp. BS3]TZF86257.1 carbohydrate kinase family protein [Pedobacter sp. BS3]
MMDNSESFDVFVCGYICVDMLPVFKKTYRIPTPPKEFFRPGMLVELDGMAFTVGGVVGNTGLVLHRIGKKVVLNGVVGDDHLGQFLTARLNEIQIESDMKKIQYAGTSFGLVLSPPGNDRMFLEYPGCSHLFDLDCVNFQQVAKSKILHFGYLPLMQKFYRNGGEDLIKLLDYARQHGTVTSMDLCLPDEHVGSGEIRWRDILHNVLPYTDIIAPSIEEILYMLMPDLYQELVAMYGGSNLIDFIPNETVQEIGRQLLGFGAKIVMIKLAHKGIYMVTGDAQDILDLGEEWTDQEIFCKAYAVEDTRFVNASGAGDSAVAVFLAALLHRKKPLEALKLAAMAGKESLYCLDLSDEFPDLNNIEQQVALENTVITL